MVSCPNNVEYFLFKWGLPKSVASDSTVVRATSKEELLACLDKYSPVDYPEMVVVEVVVRKYLTATLVKPAEYLLSETTDPKMTED